MAVLRAAVHTHTGHVRSANEDMAVITPDLVAVADGMGGHRGGEVAARTAIEALLDEYRRDRTPDGLLNASRRANRAIWRKSRADRKLRGMGTTLTAAALVPEPGEPDDSSDQGLPEHLVLVNIGDSRAYVLDPGRHVRQLTEDHSVVEDMVRHGELSPEEAAVHPHRHVLSRVLGVAPEVNLDVWDLDPVVGTRYLLCSDGLTNELADDEIAGVLADEQYPAEAARELVDRALAHGGTDNVTVVVFDVTDGEVDLADLQAEFVPARPKRPENPQLDDAEDITEAVPVTGALPDDGDDDPSAGASEVPENERPSRRWRRRRGQHGRGRATGGGATALGIASAGLGTGAPALGIASAGLGTGEAGLGTGEAGLGTGEDSPTSTAGAGKPGQDYPSGAVEVERTGERRPGRSMTVRQSGVTPGSPSTAPAGGTPPGGTPPSGAVTGGTSSTRAPRWTGPLEESGYHGGTDAHALGGVAEPGGAAAAPSHSRSMLLVQSRRNDGPKDHLVTFRVVIFVILLAATAAGTAALLLWFNQSSYFVSVKGDDVVIYQGRPGGLLWLKPVIVETSSVRRTDLLPSTVTVLRSGILESSLDSAEQVVGRLKNEALNAHDATTTTSTSAATTTTSTTTTLPYYPTTTSPTIATTIPATTVPAPTTPATIPTTTAPATSGATAPGRSSSPAAP
ncbi:MAG: protein phosphatase 2C domain-containing protein [Acidimicrobiales bacterium]